MNPAAGLPIWCARNQWANSGTFLMPCVLVENLEPNLRPLAIPARNALARWAREKAWETKC